MKNSSIYIVSIVEDSKLSKLSLILKSIDLKPQISDIEDINKHPEGIVLLDCRGLSVDRHGLPTQIKEINKKH